MEENVPDVYQEILKADIESQKKFSGHGSAIAQVYNHIIMPLANSRDKRTSVIWGIEDFRFRFKRDPEGMWLAETAVDVESLDLMAEYGIKFTILAPHQAKKIRKIGEKNWVDVEALKLIQKHTSTRRKENQSFFMTTKYKWIAFGDLLKK
jgi:alpha-amylase/alpha-mannosidase (GH57 family)